jgi:hypothetical protein
MVLEWLSMEWKGAKRPARGGEEEGGRKWRGRGRGVEKEREGGEGRKREREREREK